MRKHWWLVVWAVGFVALMLYVTAWRPKHGNSFVQVRYATAMDSNKVMEALDILAEFKAKQSEEKISASLASKETDGRKRTQYIWNSEKAHLELFTIFQELGCVYSSLVGKERDEFFELLGSKTSKEDFEETLQYSFREIDYMSAFSIPAQEHEIIKENYRRTLRERGLTACK